MAAEPVEHVLATDPIPPLVERLAEAALGLARPRIAISGGSALAVVGPLRRRLGAHWRNVRLTWADERCVPFESPDSNRGEAYRQAHLSETDPAGLELPLFGEAESPERALEHARTRFAQDFEGAIDIAILGMGGDGHVASLFPGRSLPSGPLALILDSPKPPPERITLTREVFEAAPLVVVFALGQAKRPALNRLIAGDRELPAARLPGLVVATDQDLWSGDPAKQ